MRVMLLAAVALLIALSGAYSYRMSASRRACRAPSLALSTNDLSPEGAEGTEGNIDGSDDVDDFDYQTGFVTRRKRNGGYRTVKDSRETLPFHVQLIRADGAEPVYIGTYMLDHSTSNDDLLNLGDKGFFKVRRTTFVYKFRLNRLEVVRKKLDVALVESGLYSSNSLQ